MNSESNVAVFAGDHSSNRSSGFIFRPQQVLKFYIFVAIFASIGLLGKAALLRTFLPLPQPVLAIALCIGLLLPCLAPWLLPWSKALALPLALGLLCAMVVLFPKVERMHKVGRGGDQSTCVIVAADQMMSRSWPYSIDKMWSHHPMSCGPGWVALQAPVIRWLGYPWDMITVWAASLLVIYAAAGMDAMASMLLLLCLAPVTWLACIDGSDFLTFGLAFTALMCAAARWSSRLAGKVLIVLVAALVDQFRITTLILPGLLARRRDRMVAALSFGLALAMVFVFILWNSAMFVSDGPLHILLKLQNMVATSHQRFILRSPSVVALAVFVPACVGFWIIYILTMRWGAQLVATSAFCVLFLLPAILDFATKLRLTHGLLAALGIWEGGLWLIPLLSIYSLWVVRERFRLEPVGV